MKREHAKRAPGKRARLPITPDILLALRGVWEARRKQHDPIMLWAACCLCYFGFLRAGEITVPSEAAYDPGVHLNFADVTADSISDPKLLRVKIKASKTDPFRQCVEIFIGRTGNKLCPVSAVLSYLAKRGSDKGMLFRYEDRRLLTRDRFVASVREALSAAGIDCKSYAGHSFRNRRGHSSRKTGPTTGYNPDSRPMGYLLYVRMSRQELAGVSKLISTPAQTKEGEFASRE